MNRTLLLLLACALIAAAPQGPVAVDGPWVAPSSADALIDPMAANPKAVEKGGKVFNSVCWTCHGMTGKGDGPNAPLIRKRPADLGARAVQVQTNGALYWKISQGRGEMAAFEQALSREERWALVHYIRTFAHE